MVDWVRIGGRNWAALAAAMVLTGAGRLEGPRYDTRGDFIPPGDYREWVYMSSGLDMSYSDGPPMRGQSMFDNVFVDPAAWSAFKTTGYWPDKTMFALESRSAVSHGSINRNGQYQTAERMGLEYHVRDDARFKGGWAFFALHDDGRTKFIPTSATCYACHREHGAVDTTFTQFYPTARAIAEHKGTFTAQAEQAVK